MTSNKGKILVYFDSYLQQVVVLQSMIEDCDLIRDYGRDFSDWPRDLGVYELLSSGFWVWEGIVEEEKDDLWSGEWRKLNNGEGRCHSRW